MARRGNSGLCSLVSWYLCDQGEEFSVLRSYKRLGSAILRPFLSTVQLTLSKTIITSCFNFNFISCWFLMVWFKPPFILCFSCLYKRSWGKRLLTALPHSGQTSHQRTFTLVASSFVAPYNTSHTTILLFSVGNS